MHFRVLRRRGREGTGNGGWCRWEHGLSIILPGGVVLGCRRSRARHPSPVASCVGCACLACLVRDRRSVVAAPSVGGGSPGTAASPRDIRLLGSRTARGPARGSPGQSRPPRSLFRRDVGHGPGWSGGTRCVTRSDSLLAPHGPASTGNSRQARVAIAGGSRRYAPGHGNTWSLGRRPLMWAASGVMIHIRGCWRGAGGCSIRAGKEFARSAEAPEERSRDSTKLFRSSRVAST